MERIGGSGDQGIDYYLGARGARVDHSRSPLKRLDSRFHGNDRKGTIIKICETKPILGTPKCA